MRKTTKLHNITKQNCNIRNGPNISRVLYFERSFYKQNLYVHIEKIYLKIRKKWNIQFGEDRHKGKSRKLHM